MRSPFLLALGFVALPALAAPTPASATDADRDTTVRVSNAPDSLRVRTLLAKADEASFAGRVNEARRTYRMLIDEQREADQFAGDALWRLATTNLYADDNRGAASVLDELAAAASRYGDPRAELRATFEAAVIYSHLKRHDLVAARMERVRALMQSPFISAQEKESVKGRIREG